MICWKIGVKAMMVRLLVALAMLISMSLMPNAQAQAPRPEPQGSRDHPLVGRYEGSRIHAYQQVAYDETRVITGPVTKRDVVGDENAVPASGRQTTIVYRVPADRSPLEILRNFQQTLAGRGFEQLFECYRETCGDRTGSFLRAALIAGRPLAMAMTASSDTGRYLALRLKRAEGDVLVSIYVQQVTNIIQTRVEVVEVRGMEADRIRVLGASELKSALDAAGKVALYGIYFDVDKAEIKPESKPQIDAIAAFLGANPGLNVVVSGHTDNQGAFDYNVGLSQRRAQAVARALASAGIAPARVTAFGAGMSSPVAPNDTSEGQRLNRRVEIVRR
jgi:outer membrane protein OmpA-like peptidoglycan-associated protein